MARNGEVSNGSGGTATQALRRMSSEDPELAARLVLQSLPVAAATLPAGLSYRLELEGVGAFRVTTLGDRAEVSPLDPDTAESDGDAFAISTDARTLASLAAGANPLPAMVSRRLRLRGKRRKALALRRLSQDAGPRELARMGLPVDPDLLYRSLAYAIDPDWTRGHSFTIAYELVGEGGGAWSVRVDDGSVSCERGIAEGADALVRIRFSDWMRLLAGEITPTDAMRLGLTEVDGAMPPVTLMGRWIDRAEGVDGPELAREQRQRAMQRRRAGAWGSKAGANGAGSDAGDPAEGEARRAAA